MPEVHFWKRRVEGPEEAGAAGGKGGAPSGSRESSDRQRALQEGAREAPLQPEERLVAVLHVRSIIREASDMKRLARAAEDPAARNRYAREYAALTRQLADLRDAPQAADTELAWREYLTARSHYSEWERLRAQEQALDYAIRERSIATGATAAKVKVGAKRTRETERLQAAARAAETRPAPDIEFDTETLRELFGDEAAVMVAGEQVAVPPGAVAESVEAPPRPATIAELQAQRDAIHARRLDLWRDPMVRYFHMERSHDRVRQQLHEGREVVDLPSTEQLLTKLDRFELEEPDALFGAVLVGPPGTGKTTAVREHCRRTNRQLVEIDLSGDVTRYLFWGTREIVHEDPVAKYEQLTKRIADLHGEKLVAFLRQGVEHHGPAFLGIAEDAAAGALKGIDETTAAMFKEELQRTLRSKFDEQLAAEAYKYGRENGWRAGLVMHALQRGDSILFNEFNKAKDLSFLHGLLTARAASNADAGVESKQERPGWFYVADAKQWVRLRTMIAPDGTERAASKMFFTANVGKQYKVATVLGPLASRAEGKVVEVDAVPKEEEHLLMSALVEDVAGRPVLDRGQNKQLVWLVGEVLPKVRAFIADKPAMIPISFRTIRNLAAKLVDRASGRPRSGASVDRAVVEVLIVHFWEWERNPRL